MNTDLLDQIREALAEAKALNTGAQEPGDYVVRYGFLTSRLETLLDREPAGSGRHLEAWRWWDEEEAQRELAPWGLAPTATHAHVTLVGETRSYTSRVSFPATDVEYLAFIWIGDDAHPTVVRTENQYAVAIVQTIEIACRVLCGGKP